MMHLEAIKRRNAEPAPSPSMIDSLLYAAATANAVRSARRDRVGPMDHDVFVRDPDDEAIVDHVVRTLSGERMAA